MAREIEECDNLKQRIQTFLDEVGQTRDEIPALDGPTENGTASSNEKVQDDEMEEQRRLWKLVQDMKDV